METEVIIIGAGPTGLMAACQLSRFGIEFVIADRKSKPTEESRAMIVTARSMEIYQQMGLSDTILDKGKIISSLSVISRGKEKVDFPIGKSGEGLTDFPYMLAFEQSANERLMYETLQQQNKQVLWCTEFISLQQEKDHVMVRLKKINGEEILVRGKYLVACDGAGSAVRQFLKCRFEGGTYENKFFVADTKLSWDQPFNKLIAAPSRKNFSAFFPMHGDQHYRVLGTLPKAYRHQENISFNQLEEVIRSTIGIPLRFEEVNWFSIYHLHHRCADKFRINRCFLAGDAAHIHSPAGGQGMNTGLQDVYNLSWKLAMVLRSYASDRLLNTYHIERYPFAKWLLKFTDRIFGFMTSSNVLISFLRLNLLNLFIGRMISKTSSGVRIFRIFSQIWYSYKNSPLSVQQTKQKLSFGAGDRFPYVMVNTDGKIQSCSCLFTAPKFHFVVIADGHEVFQESNIPGQLKAIIEVINLPLSDEWMAIGVKKPLYILVRPDNHIAMACDEFNESRLLTYFIKLNEHQ